MASAEETEFDEGFTHAEEVLADGDLVGPEPTDPVHPEPVPITSKELKEKVDKGEEESGGGAVHKLKSTLLISAAAAAVAGVIFAIAKKIKEA